MFGSQPKNTKHGEVDAASKTLLHEILEFKLEDYTRVYRTIINCLTEALEKAAYVQKEEFLNFCLELAEKLKR